MRRFLYTLAAGFAAAGLTLFAPTVVSAAPAGCHPSYQNICLPTDRDVDCYEIANPPVKVTGPDFHRLDRDEDGLGCEVDDPSVKESTEPEPATSSSAPAQISGFVPDGPCTAGQEGIDATAGDGKVYGCQKSAEDTDQWVQVTTGDGGAALPKTGFNADQAMAAGVVLLGLGGGMLWYFRGRRYTFQAR